MRLEPRVTISRRWSFALTYSELLAGGMPLLLLTMVSLAPDSAYLLFLLPWVGCLTVTALIRIRFKLSLLPTAVAAAFLVISIGIQIYLWRYPAPPNVGIF